MTTDIVQGQLFDYASLDSETREFVQAKAQDIHTRLKRTAEDVIAIGQDLIEVKNRLGHGKFLVWVDAEFSMSDRHARRFMAVADKFGKSDKMSIFPVSILYELASPSTPDAIIEMVETGQISPTLPAIRGAKRELQQEQRDIPLTQTEIQTLEPQTRPAYGPAYQSPAYSEREIHQTQNLTPQQFVDEVFPGFTRWKEDNASIGLDSFNEPLEQQVPQPYPPDEAPVPTGQDTTSSFVPTPHRGVPAALQMSESNEWYTPAPYVDAARALMGGIDVDPASNAYANEKVIQATTYYDIHANGLDKEWRGRVWMNPPYGREAGDSNQETWTHRLIEQFDAGITQESVLLVNAVTDRKWFQPLWRFPICFTNHRIRFYNTETEAGQPTHGNALVYIGPKEKLAHFVELFKQFGPIVQRIDVWQ